MRVTGTVRVENVAGQSTLGERSLALHYRGVATGRMARVATPTFIPSKAVADYFSGRGYALIASPTLYPGQTVRARVVADAANVQPVACNLYIRYYGTHDELLFRRSPAITLAATSAHEFVWLIDDLGGAPIAEIGVEISSAARVDGTLYLDYLTWDGTPNVTFKRPDETATSNPPSILWRLAWVDGMDQYDWWWPEAYRLVQNTGRGLLIQGTREWQDYQVASSIIVHLAQAAGIAARVQGMQRYYALLLCADGKARLIKALDGDQVLAEIDFAWAFGVAYTFTLRVQGQQLEAAIDGTVLFSVEDHDQPLDGGGVAFVCEAGRLMSEAMTVRPL